MMKRKIQLVLTIGSLTAAAAAFAAPGTCGDQTSFVESQSLCAGEQGIPLTNGSGKVGCYAEPAVQNQCGSDGRITRLHAWAEWLRQLKQFQETCADRGGDFAFADPHFIEPTDENFCLAAQPMLGSSMFEEPTCNFRSICPAVQVLCALPCAGEGDRAAADATAGLMARQ